MTIPFYFPRSLVSLAQAFDFYFSRLVLAISSILEVHLSPLRTARLPPNTVHRRTEVYLNVFRDRAIHPYCSASSIGFQFFEGYAGPGCYLFTVMGAVASIRLVEVYRAARSFLLLFSILLRFVAVQRTCLD